jgi:hypothetical protein
MKEIKLLTCCPEGNSQPIFSGTLRAPLQDKPDIDFAKAREFLFSM